jgi:hypothetical protein
VIPSAVDPHGPSTDDLRVLLAPSLIRLPAMSPGDGYQQDFQKIDVVDHGSSETHLFLRVSRMDGFFMDVFFSGGFFYGGFMTL